MKKIIALAIAGAFITPAAMATVEIYGYLGTSVEYSKISAPNAAQSSSRVRLYDQSSRLGFRGTDKLDNGLTVLWRAEQRVRVGSSSLNGTNDASAGWGDRSTFVGLQGDFGQVRIGKMFDAMDESRDDFFVAMNNGYTDETSGGVGQFVRRGAAKPTSIIMYTSPSMGGVRTKLQYDFGSKSGTYSANGYTGSVFYKSDMFDVGAAYKQMNDSKANNADYSSSNLNSAYGYKNYLVGATIKPVSGLKLSVAAERVKADTGVTTYEKQDGYAVGAVYETGKFSYGMTLGMLKDKKTQAGTSADTGSWGLNAGMQYALSKQTKLTAGLSYVKNDAKASTQSGSVKSVAADNSTTITGTKISAISIGMRTAF